MGLCSKVTSLLFNMLSRLVIAFLPRRKHLWISWLQSPSAMILEPKKIKTVTVSIVCPSICHEIMGLDAIILDFWMLNFKLAFSLTFIKRLFCNERWSLNWEVASFLFSQMLIEVPFNSHFLLCNYWEKVPPNPFFQTETRQRCL